MTKCVLLTGWRVDEKQKSRGRENHVNCRGERVRARPQRWPRTQERDKQGMNWKVERIHYKERWGMWLRDEGH